MRLYDEDGVSCEHSAFKDRAATVSDEISKMRLLVRVSQYFVLQTGRRVEPCVDRQNVYDSLEVRTYEASEESEWQSAHGAESCVINRSDWYVDKCRFENEFAGHSHQGRVSDMPSLESGERDLIVSDEVDNVHEEYKARILSE